MKNPDQLALSGVVPAAAGQDAPKPADASGHLKGSGQTEGAHR